MPVNNARYALNAAIFGEPLKRALRHQRDPGGRRRGARRGYNPVRGTRVVAEGRKFLDRMAPLAGASHSEVTGYAVVADGRARHG